MPVILYIYPFVVPLNPFILIYIKSLALVKYLIYTLKYNFEVKDEV